MSRWNGGDDGPADYRARDAAGNLIEEYEYTPEQIADMRAAEQNRADRLARMAPRAIAILDEVRALANGRQRLDIKLLPGGGWTSQIPVRRRERTHVVSLRFLAQDDPDADVQRRAHILTLSRMLLSVGYEAHES